MIYYEWKHWEIWNSFVDRLKSTISKNSNSSIKPTYKCTHCNLTCQSKSHCFELIGYPNWWNPTKHQNSTRPSHATIAQKMEVIAFPKSLALLPTIDIGGKAFTTFMPLLNRAWMIDSGITNRMRFDVRQVSNFYSSFQNCVSTSP